MLTNIPLELRLAKRWALTGDLTDTTNPIAKAPHAWSAKLNCFEMISVHDTHCLVELDQLLPTLKSNPNRGVGFIMHEGDGFTCIDIDTKESAQVDQTRRNWELVESLSTYTEVSNSGTGYHIWLKGEIDGAIKRAEIEVYSRERFMICTGHVLLDLPIVYDESVISFFNDQAQSGATEFNLIDGEQKQTDEEVMRTALDNDHSGKLSCLVSGDWGAYEHIMRNQGAAGFNFDASQADSAFMTIITYYTNNIEQCKRLWRISALSDVNKRYPNDTREQQRKLKNLGSDYKLHRAIAYGMQKNKMDAARRMELADEARNANQAVLLEAERRREGVYKAQEGVVLPVAGDLQFPPGMLGELCKYFMTQSIKPVKEFAIAEALAVASGVFGRTHNISGTGLNTYLMILAESGAGKSALSKNPKALMQMVERQGNVIGATQFVVTNQFTHQNAMLQEFKDRSQFVQCLSEFGKVFKNMVSESSAGGALGTVREAMTDIYSKSGQFDVVGGLRYSNMEKTVNLPYPVGFSFLGESVHEPFFNSITADMFTDGFMSRMTVMEYNGVIPYDAAITPCLPPAHLFDHIKALTANAVGKLRDINVCEVTNVGMDADAGKWFSDFSRECTDNVNKHRDFAFVASLWTRANLKTLKYAALLAAFDNFERPVINMSHVEWAFDFVSRHNYLIYSASQSGLLGSSGELEQMDALREIIIGFNDKKRNVKSYHPKAEEMRENGHIPWGYIQRIAGRRACFNPKDGWKKPSQILRDCILDMIRAGTVRQLSRQECADEYKTQAEIFQLIN